MNYKELIIEAKKQGVVYAWREGGKTIWKQKERLEAELGLTPASKDTPVETANAAQVKTMGTLERAILDLVGNNIQERLEEIEAKLGESNGDSSYKGIEIKTPTKINRIEGLTHECFEHVLRLASQRQNILLVGPAGTGKTHLAAQIAEALGLPFAFISASAGMSEAALEGHLLPTGESGRFEYCTSQFVYMYENGGVFLIDELDSADANLMTIINSALANGHMAINKRFGNPIAKRHADFICIAAANTFGHGPNRTYAGRQQLDAATLDRFRAGVVYVDYDAKIEEKTIRAELLAWGRDIRSKIAAHGLRRIMSTRFLKNYSVMIDAYPEHYSLDTAKETYFSDWSIDEKGKVS